MDHPQLTPSGVLFVLMAQAREVRNLTWRHSPELKKSSRDKLNRLD